MSRLFLIPTTLSNTIDHNVILPAQLAQLTHIRHFIVETAKTARAHLKQLKLTTSLQDLNIQELNKHSKNIQELITPLLSGFDVGLLSDCGLPAIADPGSQIVALAHKHSIEVVPLVGPSSLLLALMSSGVNGQSFAFTGYLPIDNQLRLQKIRQLEHMVLQEQQSQIIIETPFRNQQLLNTLIENLNSQLILGMAIDLMQPQQKIISQSVKAWQKQATLPELHKHEVVFILGS